jgi:hypothetical protein
MQVSPESHRTVGYSDPQNGPDRSLQGPAARRSARQHEALTFEAAPVPTPEEIEVRCREIRRRWSEEVTASRLGIRSGSGSLGWQPPIICSSEIGPHEDL